MILSRVHLLSAMIISSILFPWIPVPAGLPELRPEWFILLIGCSLMTISRKAFYSDITLLASIVFVSFLISIVYGQLFLGILIDFRDFTVLMQPALYLLFYLFCASATLNENQYIKLLRVLLLSLFLSAVIGLVQFFNPDLASPILNLYRDKQTIDLFISMRATGTVANPNVFGLLMNIGFALSLFTFKHKIFSRIFAWVLLTIFFLAVIVSGSRTAMVINLAILFLFIALEVRFNFKRLLIIVILFGGLSWLFLSSLYEMGVATTLLDRVMSLQALTEAAGWQLRLGAASNTLILITESIFFGHGPAKLVFTSGGNVDNEYILLLYRHGLFGTLATIGFIACLAMQLKSISAKSVPILHSMRQFTWTILLACSLFAFTASVFMQFRLFGLLIIIWTITARVHTESFQAPNSNVNQSLTEEL